VKQPILPHLARRKPRSGRHGDISPLSAAAHVWTEPSKRWRRIASVSLDGIRVEELPLPKVLVLD
jgi:hypothetical protein